MDDSEHDALPFMALPVHHRVKLRSTNPLERLDRKVKRLANVVGKFPKLDFGQFGGRVGAG